MLLVYIGDTQQEIAIELFFFKEEKVVNEMP